MSEDPTPITDPDPDPGGEVRPANLTLIVNPQAGRGRAGRMVPTVSADLLRRLPGVDLTVHRTESFQHAREVADQAAELARPVTDGERPDSVVMMGGDGMAHLGLNACAGSPAALGVIPAGTGNDFVRGIGAPTQASGAIAAIIAGHTRQIDLTLVEGRLHREPDGIAHVGSVVSTGYDAVVNRGTNGLATRIGPLAYAWVALRELARFAPLPYRISLDGEQRELPAILVAVGNAGFFGGGMRICPDADVSDGLLDVTIVHPIPRTAVLRLLPQLFTGGFVSHPAVELTRARQVTIDGDDMFAMADGEDLGDVPLRLEADPGALRVYC